MKNAVRWKEEQFKLKFDRGRVRYRSKPNALSLDDLRLSSNRPAPLVLNGGTCAVLCAARAWKGLDRWDLKTSNATQRRRPCWIFRSGSRRHVQKLFFDFWRVPCCVCALLSSVRCCLCTLLDPVRNPLLYAAVGRDTASEQQSTPKPLDRTRFQIATECKHSFVCLRPCRHSSAMDVSDFPVRVCDRGEPVTPTTLAHIPSSLDPLVTVNDMANTQGFLKSP
jgi:hypothetical protein